MTPRTSPPTRLERLPREGVDTIARLEGPGAQRKPGTITRLEATSKPTAPLRMRPAHAAKLPTSKRLEPQPPSATAGTKRLPPGYKAPTQWLERHPIKRLEPGYKAPIKWLKPTTAAGVDLSTQLQHVAKAETRVLEAARIGRPAPSILEETIGQIEEAMFTASELAREHQRTVQRADAPGVAVLERRSPGCCPYGQAYQVLEQKLKAYSAMQRELRSGGRIAGLPRQREPMRLEPYRIDGALPPPVSLIAGTRVVGLPGPGRPMRLEPPARLGEMPTAVDTSEFPVFAATPGGTCCWNTYDCIINNSVTAISTPEAIYTCCTNGGKVVSRGEVCAPCVYGPVAAGGITQTQYETQMRLCSTTLTEFLPKIPIPQFKVRETVWGKPQYPEAALGQFASAPTGPLLPAFGSGLDSWNRCRWECEFERRRCKRDCSGDPRCIAGCEHKATICGRYCGLPT